MAVGLPCYSSPWYPLHPRPLHHHFTANSFLCPSGPAPICFYRVEGMGWQMWPCFLRMLHDALWPIDTTAVRFVVEGAFIQLSLLLGGTSILFGTLASFLAHLVPIPLVRVDGGRWRCTYPSLPLSSGY
jgi:hypothetical protein